MKRVDPAIFYILLFLGLSMSLRAQDRENPVVAVLKTPDRVHAVAFSPNDLFLAAGIGWGEKGGARIWSLPSQKVMADITTSSGSNATVEAIAFSADGRLFAMADWGGDVTIWNTKNWRLMKTLAKGQTDAQTVSFSPDATHLLVTREHALVLVNVASGATRVLENRSKGSYVEARYSDNEQIIVSDDSATRILDLRSKREIRKWNVDNLFFGKLSDDHSYLVTGGGAMYGKKILRVMDLRADKTIADVQSFRDGLYGLAYSQNKATFAVSGGGYGSGGFVSVWDTAAGKELGYVSFGEFPIQGLAYSHDDKLLAAGSESGAVVLYDPAKLRGPEIKKQDHPLCGEVLREDGKTYIVPLTKVPHPMNRDDGMDYSWKLEIVNSERVEETALAIHLKDWDLESGSDGDRVRIADVAIVNSADKAKESIVFAQIQNPGWNLGQIAKLYSDGSYVATDNPRKCVAVGKLDKMGTNLFAVKNRLTDGGFLTLKQEPLTSGSAHFSTRFIAIRFEGALAIRSDAEDFGAMLKGAPPRKREAFDLIYSKEESFIKELIRLGSIAPGSKQ